jgi:hypothetical protein
MPVDGLADVGEYTSGKILDLLEYDWWTIISIV